MGDERTPIDELVDRARCGDESAFGDLYRLLQPQLLGFLRALAPDAAEDLAAEAWVQAAGRLPAMPGDGPGFRRLLFTIGRRRAADHHRARGRRRTDPVDAAALARLRGPDDPAATVLDAEAGRAAVARIVALLPRAQAEVVVLRVVSGLSVAEVAEVVGRSPAAVSVLLSRALQRLADRMGDRPRSAPESTRR
jgi:RNA polymerase sigma-70 factor (ECF subfamily)